MQRQTFSAIGFILVLSTALRAAPTTAPAAGPLADRVPDDAIYYVGWAGADAIPSMPSYGQSNLKSLLDSSNIRQVASEVVPRLLAKLAKQAGPETAGNVDNFKLIAGTLWKYPTAVYFTVDMTGTPPMPHAAIFSRAGSEAGAVQGRLDDLLSRGNMPPEVPVRTFVVDDIVGVSIGFDDGTNALAGEGDNKSKPITSTDGFKQAMSQVGTITPSQNPDNVFIAYYDNDAMMALADKGVQMSQNADVIDHWSRAKAALGLADLHHIAAATGFDGKDWSGRAFIEAPATRKGIFALMDRAPVSDEALAMIPQSATSMSAGGINLARIVEQLRAITGEIDPQVQSHFNQAFGAVQLYTGVNLEKDLFANLGEHWVAYDDPDLTGPGLTNFVIVNHPTDAAKVQSALDSLATAFTNTMSGLLRPKHLELAVRQVKSGDITVSYLASPVFAPCWTIHDGYLYFALYPQNAIAAAKRGKPAHSILENEAFNAVRKRLGVTNATSIVFDDLPKSLPGNYQSLLLLTRSAMGAADLFGGRAPELVVPPMDELIKHVAPSGMVSWMDDQGLHVRSISPFPGAELVSQPARLLFAAAPIAAISAANEQKFATVHVEVNNGMNNEERAECAAHLRDIGQALMTYANDHKGAFPPDLGTLASSSSVSADTFLCPTHHQSAPANWDDMNEDQKTGWINKNTDFVYLGAGKQSTIGAGSVLVYERESRGTKGLNILFADAHVEFVNLHDAKDMIAKQGK